MFPSPAERSFKDTLTWRIAAALPFLGFLAWGIYNYRDTQSFEPVLWSFVGITGLFIRVCMPMGRGAQDHISYGRDFLQVSDERR